MSTDDVETRVKSIIASEMGLSVVEVSLKDTLEADLGADSLDVVEVEMALEAEFSNLGVAFNEATLKPDMTVADVVNIINCKITGPVA